MRSSLLNDIHIANDSHFISIGGGKYYYFSKGIFSKKAFIITSKEKKELEKISQTSMLKLVGAGTFFTTVSLINVFWAILGVSVFGMYFCFRIYSHIKKILKDKERVLVRERKWSDYFASNAKQQTYKCIFKRLFISLLLFIIPFFSGSGDLENSMNFMVIMIFVGLFVSLAIINDLIHLFFKLTLASDIKNKP